MRKCHKYNAWHSMDRRTARDEQPGHSTAEPCDCDPEETRDWLQALAAVQQAQGPERVAFLLDRLAQIARQPRLRGRVADRA